MIMILVLTIFNCTNFILFSIMKINKLLIRYSKKLKLLNIKNSFKRLRLLIKQKNIKFFDQIINN